MRTSVQQAPLYTVDPVLYKQMLKLNFGNIGLMYDQCLLERRRKRHSTRAFWIEGPGMKVLGWSLVFNPDASPLRISWMFIAEEHRRKGLGARLFKTIKRRYVVEPTVQPWDRVSDSFFNSVGAKNLDPV